MAGIAHVITSDSASGAQVIDGTLKFNGSNHYLNLTPGSGNRRTWTLSFWIKRGIHGTSQHIIGNYYNSANDGFNIRFDTDNKLQLFDLSGGAYTNGFNVVPTQVFRDNGWYHIVVVLDTAQSTSTDRLKVYVNGTQVTSFSTTDFPDQNNEYNFNTENSLSIGRGGSYAGQYFDGYLSNYYHVDGQALGPDSFGFTDPLTNTWRPKKVKFPKRTFTNPKWYSSATLYTSVADVVANATDRGNGGVTVSNEYCYLVFNDGGYANNGGGLNSPDYPVWTDTASFNDGSEGTISRVFYYDTSEGDNWKNAATYGSTASEWNRWRYSTSSTYDSYRIGKDFGIDGGNMLVFCANATIDNPTNAGKLSSATLPTFDTGSFHVQNLVRDTFNTGGNSFYLPFDGNSSIGEDKFNNGNNFTPQNFSGTSVDPDVLKDSPSGAVSGRSPTSGITTTNFPPSNYATLNPLDVDGSNGTFVMADGNLEMNTFATNYSVAASTITFDPGDLNGFYFESTGTNSAQYAGVGVAEAGTISGITGSPGRDGNLKQILIRSDGFWYYNSGSYLASGKTTWTSSDVIGCAFKNNKIWVSKNGVYIESGDPVTEANPNLTWDPANHTNDKVNFIVSAYTSNPTVKVNFGQKPFKYAPPDGFRALNLANIRPETVITRPDQIVGVTTYTGNGSSQNILTGFQPDLVWHKARDANNAYQIWSDSVRGTAKILRSDSGNAQQDYGSYGVTNYLFNGYVVTDNAPGDYNTNGSAGGTYAGSSGGYVSWAWKAGGNKNTFNIDDVGYASAAAAGLSGGDLTITGASVGTKNGFSIIKYTGNNSTGQTVKHGLTQKPDFIICKNTEEAYDWMIYHKSMGATYYGLFGPNAFLNNADIWADTEPTDSQFYVSVHNSPDGYSNGPNGQFISYIWHDVPGLQKFGSYSGNSDGTTNNGIYIELGFRPSIIMIKASNHTSDWAIIDADRSPYNPAGTILKPNTSDDEDTSSNYYVDILSNGFKLRTDTHPFNAGYNYIYCAWAESPTVNLFGAGANAR